MCHTITVRISVDDEPKAGLKCLRSEATWRTQRLRPESTRRS